MPLKQVTHTQISFRPTRDSDVDFLYALHVATMKEYVEKTWGWNDAFQESLFRRNYAPGESQIITLNENDIGMISIESKNDDVFLRAIEIHPEYQRQGLGRGIIRAIIDDAIRSGKPVSLRVLKVNPAKRLYERLGFETVEETSTHYMMRKSLSQ